MTGITEAVTGLRAAGYSWAGIAARLGVPRQAAQQRWGRARHRPMRASQMRQPVRLLVTGSRTWDNPRTIGQASQSGPTPAPAFSESPDGQPSK